MAYAPASLLTLLLAGCGQVQPEIMPLFSAHTLHHATHAYHYRLHEPIFEASTATRFPLIVWLHGQGEQGEDNVDQLEWLDKLIFLPPRKAERYPFFLLAVQCPKAKRTWFRENATAAEAKNDMLEVTYAAVQNLIQNKAIDADRVYLAGLSAGGTACWELALRYPERFAAVLPLASVGTFRADLERLRGIPVWAFHSAHDGGIEMLRTTVSSLERLGGNVRLTELPSADHNCWCSAFQDHHALEWLLAQRRGRYSRAGSIPAFQRLWRLFDGWRWWQLLLQGVVIWVLGMVACKAIAFLWMHEPSPPKATRLTRKR